MSFPMSPRPLLFWMAWPDHFVKGLLSFLFMCLSDGCFAGWLGMAWPVILPQVCFHVFSLVSQIDSFLVGLATSTCQRFAFMISLVRLFCHMSAVSFM